MVSMLNQFSLIGRPEFIYCVVCFHLRLLIEAATPYAKYIYLLQAKTNVTPLIASVFNVYAFVLFRFY